MTCDQDYEVARRGLNAAAKHGDVTGAVDSLARLHSEAAKVPGLEADNAALLTTLRDYYEAERKQGTPSGITVGEWHQRLDIVEMVIGQPHPGAALLERLAKAEADIAALTESALESENARVAAESERDAARDGWRVESARLAGTRDELRECVSTVERERTAAGETEHDLLKSIENLNCMLEGVQEGATIREWDLVAEGVARADTAEARVKELEAAANYAVRSLTAAESHPNVLEKLRAALASHPPPAPAQGAERGPRAEEADRLYGVIADGTGPMEPEAFAALGQLRDMAEGSPTAPALVEAVGKVLEEFRKWDAATGHLDGQWPMKVEAPRSTWRVALAAYDAAKGGGK